MSEQNMNTVVSHVSRGNALRKAGELDMAKAEYQIALRLDPKAAGAALGLGYVLHMQHRLAKALECYTRAIAENAEDVEALRNRGRATVALGDYWLPRPDLRVAIDIREGYGGVSNLTGSTIDRAIVDLNDAISSEPQRADLYLDRAIIHLIREEYFTSRQSEDVVRAIEDLERASALDSTLGDPHLLRAVLWEQIFLDPKAAQRSFALAIDLGSSIEPRHITKRRANLTRWPLGPFGAFFARIATRFCVLMLIAMLFLRWIAPEPGLTVRHVLAVMGAAVLSVMCVVFLLTIDRTAGRGFDWPEMAFFGVGFVIWAGIDLLVHTPRGFRLWSVLCFALASVVSYVSIMWLPSSLLTRNELRRIHSQPGRT